MFRSFGLVFLLSALFTLPGCDGASGGGESGEGPGVESAGHEGGGEGGGEDGGGFVSDRVSRGTFKSVPLLPGESFAGLFDDTEVAIMFDADQRMFIGRLRNEADIAVCEVRATADLGGFAMLDYEVDGLQVGGRTSFELAPDAGVQFDEWTVEVETHGCTSVAAMSGQGGEGGGEGSEGSHAEGGGEGGDDGGGESGEGGGEGGESGDESSPAILLADDFAGTIGNQAFSFTFDATSSVFRGSVENVSDAVVCQSRTEMHLGSGSSVIELGPTIPVDLDPAETLLIVMSAGGYALDTYTLHPESSPCDGSGGEGGSGGDGD